MPAPIRACGEHGYFEDAREVGARHADEPAVLAVDAAAMRGDGHRIAKRGEGTYTAEHVPPEYVERLGACRREL